MTGPVRTRLAPTPSGYLHLGNAWSFVLTWLMARSRGGTLHLRIDDLDGARLRQDYLEDIFSGLAWLGLDYDSGPRDSADFQANYSQRLRRDAYQSALERLMFRETGAGLRGVEPRVYACACTRGDIRRAAGPGAVPGYYPGTCRSRGWDLTDVRKVLRLRVESDREVTLRDANGGDIRLRPAETLGDFVIRKGQGEPAYQLGSVVDDASMGIGLVVRGRDLLDSSGAQGLLAEHLGYAGFLRAEFLHHGLFTGADGDKLSKSAGDVSLRAMRERMEGPSEVYRHFASLLGMDPRGISRAVDLLPGFDPGRIPTGPHPFADFASRVGWA